MPIYPTNILFVLTGIFLATFCRNRYSSYKKNPSNHITYYYFLASLFVSIALFTYGLPIFFTNNQNILSVFTIIALILNAIGFNHFFLITLYTWLSRRSYVIAKYILFIFVVILTGLMVINPPIPTLDNYNVIHWGFSPIVGILAAVHMDIVFASNIILIMMHFYRLKKLSIMNSTSLIITFIITGLSGSYLYAGNTTIGLFFSSIMLYLGIATIFFSVVHGAMNRILEWQIGDGGYVELKEKV